MSLPRKNVPSAKAGQETSPPVGLPVAPGKVAGPFMPDQQSVMLEMVRANPNIPAEQKKSILEQMNRMPPSPVRSTAGRTQADPQVALNLSGMKYEELLDWQQRIAKEIEARKPQIKKEFLEEVKAKAAALGLTVEELFAPSEPGAHPLSRSDAC